jgi:hypothetical protein
VPVPMVVLACLGDALMLLESGEHLPRQHVQC